MKLDLRFLRSKVGRRILTLFILCALLPIGALAIISFTHVTRQFNEQSQRRLRQASKSQGMAIFERLQLLEAGLMMIAAELSVGSDGAIHTPSEGFDENLERRFEGLAIVSDGGRQTPLFGGVQVLPELIAVEMQHLSSGWSLLTSQSGPKLPLPVLMMRALDPLHPKRGILVAEINATYLWGLKTLSPLTELCVLEQSNRLLFCSSANPALLLEQLTREVSRLSTGHFEWKDEEEEYMAGYWSMFLKPTFLAPDWIVVMSESKANVLAPLADFRKTFPLVILMSIWVVLLLSLIQIRRSLVPLEKLQEGTRRIAQRDFNSRVTVTSGDEFQELATSFNTMAGRLGRQFSALTMMNEIDRAILTALDTEEVANTLLTRMRDILPFESISVTFFDSDDTQVAKSYVGHANPSGGKQVVRTTLTSEEVQILRNSPENVTINGDKINGDASLPSYLAPLAGRGMGLFLVLPLFVEDRLSGIISLGRLAAAAYSQEDLLQARQVADQVAVALSSAHLVTQRRELTSLFERYVSPEVAAEILKRRREIVLAGQEHTATVLFSDIRNFTALTAGKPSAQVLSWLNNYFTAMSEIIMRNGGFLNKFMGDGLLVVFGVPLSESVEQDACQAVRSALEMLDRVEGFNAEKRADQPRFQIGIGLHTGTLTAGNVGTRERMEYSVIGETVNLASRLQALSKEFKIGFVISAQTQELVKAQFDTKLLGEVALRGFPGRSAVYTVANRAKSENCRLTEGGSASDAI